MLEIVTMKRCRLTLFLFLTSFSFFGQYTDQINSNRPGASIGAFSVGKRVIQFEAGGEYRKYKHKGYNNSTIEGKIGFFALRYGFLKEQLELTVEGTYQFDELTNRLSNPAYTYKREGYLASHIGLKYLIFDPFRRETETNVYSWKANNRFRLRDLVPAVSITLGTNVNLKNQSPYPFGNVFSALYRPVFYKNLGIRPEEEPIISGRATLATQSHFFGTWVFVTNFTYNRILTNYPEMSYILTLTHTLDPLWSVYLETQGISSDVYIDQLFRVGAAYLLTDDIQLEATLGANAKETPSLFFVNAGVSYRLDFHKDIDPAKKQEEKLMRKQEKGMKKGARKAKKLNNKRNRRARRN